LDLTAGGFQPLCDLHGPIDISNLSKIKHLINCCTAITVVIIIIIVIIMTTGLLTSK